jgi:hypothetical protein
MAEELERALWILRELRRDLSRFERGSIPELDIVSYI